MTTIDWVTSLVNYSMNVGDDEMAVDLTDIDPTELEDPERLAALYEAESEEEAKAEQARREREEAEAREEYEAEQREIAERKREIAEREREAERERAEREEAERREAEKRERKDELARKREAKRREAEASRRYLTAWVVIGYDGRIYAVPRGATPETVLTPYDGEYPKWTLRDLVKSGFLFTKHGDPIKGDDHKSLKALLLGKYGDVPRPGEVPSQKQTWLIRGLWPVGWIPGCFGQYQVGKTTMIVRELISSLLVPGHRFLNHYDPVEDFLLTEIRRRGVWLINAKAPVAAVEDALHLVDEAGQRDSLIVDHLDLLGGAQQFDLTKPEIYQKWWHRLRQRCIECDGTDFIKPFVVIVDGLTEILVAAGKDIERDSAEWFAAFKRLMKALGIPCALVVGHSTMKGDHGMGGTDFLGMLDGSWRYFSDDPDNPDANRYFKVLPSIGGVATPKSQVTLDDDGRLTLHPKGWRKGSRNKPSSSPSEEAPGAEAAEAGTDDQPPPSVKELVLIYVRGCNAQAKGYGPSKRQIRENVVGRSPEIDAAITELTDLDKQLEVRPRKGQGGGHAYWAIG